jgi:hypothetical protein
VEAQRLDALRRRLYAPDVTERDVAAYREAEAETAADGPPADPGGRGRRFPERRRLAVAGGAVLLVIVGVVLLLTTRPLAAVVASGTSPTPTHSATPTFPQSRIPASASARLQFIRSLQTGDTPGLLEYLYGHPSYLPAAIRTPGRSNSTEYSGQGSGTITLDPSELAQRGGHVTVILVTDRPATVSWRTARIAQRNDRSGPVVPMASHAGSTRAGEPISATSGYGGSAPARLALSLDETIRWGAVVVFTD